MPRWTCYARGCRGHSGQDDVCPSGVWKCRRTRPPCGDHGERDHQCPEVANDAWTCRAEGCPTHDSPSHECEEIDDRPAHWRCNLVTPRCPTHEASDDQCDPDEARVREAAVCSSSDPADGAVVSCPQNVQTHVISLVEVLDDEEQAAATSSRRQYVNLDQDADPEGNPRYEYGRTITLKARIGWRARNGATLEGITVYFSATPGDANKAGLTGTDRAGFRSPGGSLRARVETQDDGWTEPLTFYLSRYGGDSFEIRATTDDNYEGGMQAGPYVVWKRIWYEIVEMERPNGGKFEMPARTLELVRDAFLAVKVEFLSAGSRDTGEYVQNFASKEDSWDWGDDYVSDFGVPWKIQYLVVNCAVPIDDREEDEVEGSCTATPDSPDSTEFRPYNFDGEEWLIRARYRHDGEWHDFPDGKVTLADRGSTRSRIRFDFSGTGVTPTTAAPVDVKVRVWKAPGYNGWGGANLHCTICRGSMESAYDDDELARAMAGTAIHEPGHALRLVYGQSWETNDADHANHCSVEQCVMWWEGYVGRPTSFHETSGGGGSCHTYVRGKNMERDRMGRWERR